MSNVVLNTPCGKTIEVCTDILGNRHYYDTSTGDPIWIPNQIHRTALLICMVYEDECKYKEKVNNERNTTTTNTSK